MKRVRGKGFTLLELLVAITVFVLLAAIAYGGLNTVLQGSRRIENEADRLKQLQQALRLVSDDLRQFIQRPVRDEYGDQEEALLVANGGEQRILFTRAGYINPLGLPRSEMLRVAYLVEDDTLVRLHWPTLDRSQGNEPYRVALLSGVAGLEIRLLDDKGNWQDEWPPQSRGQVDQGALPKGLELILDLEGWGSLRRLYRLADG